MYVFLIAGRNQAADFERVAPFLDASTGIMLGAEDLRIGARARPADTDSHVPGTDAGRSILLLRRLEQLRRRFGRFVLVSGQDVGTLQRLAFTWAARRGCGRALIPDGVAFSPPRYGPPAASSLLGRARALVDRSGLLLGSPDQLGGTGPELIASWGVGWNALWADHASGAQIAVTGSPRFDGLAALPDVGTGSRVLLASQPLWQGGFDAGDDELDRWYRWLGASAELLAATHAVRVRLHPAEHGVADEHVRRYGLAPYIADESLDEVLGWASHVVAPASTIVLEAAAAGRRAALVAATVRVPEKWAASPLFGERSWTRLGIDEPLSPEDIDFRPFDGSRFLANTGGAASAVAAALNARFS